ncbi:MAG: T9SS type A sorting domain-containing protein [Phycisphaerae bacterium]|nr:T9SS type A sorting domain-containing protein [Saprospiraceae bacterium]
MKRLVLLLPLTFMIFINGNAQTGPFLCPADTLQNIQWENLQGPPAKATAFVQSRERVFAATDNGLFFSDNAGGTWVLHPQTKGKKIENLFANDSVVLFQYVRTLSIGPHTVPAVKQFEVYRYLNGGVDFDLIFSLDGDMEYFGTVLHPYLWTKFIDLGEGFMYFEHGVPYLGYGSWNPAQNTRYFTRDNGKHWQFVSLTYTGLMPPVSKIFQTLSFCHDTLLGVQYVWDTTGNGNSGYQINLYPKGEYEGNALTDTLLPMPSGAQYFLHFNQDLYHIYLGFGSFKPYVKQFRDVLSSSFPSDIVTDTLFFPNEPIQNPVKFWNTDTILWFEFANGNVYRSTIQNPQAVIFQYKKPAKPSWATIFAVLPAGQYANNKHFETLHSADDGNTWSKSYEGLSIGAFLLNDQCGQVLASPRLESYPTSHIYYRLNVDGSWEYLDSTLEKTLRWTVGKAFGDYYMSSGLKIYKTDECATPPEWKISALNANDWGDTIFQSGNRAYAYRKHCSGCKVYVSDDGETWSQSGLYTDGTMSVFGDTIIQLHNDKVRFSTDFGLNWLQQTFPQAFDFSWIIFENHKLIALNELDSSLQWLICSNLLQADDPNSWQGQCSLAKPYHAYAAFGDVIIPAKMVAYTNGLIFLHAQEGLYISNDASKSWHRLPDLPFENEYERPHYSNGQIQYGSAEGGNGYNILDGYLYAYTNTTGVWRTELQPILEQLPEVVLNAQSVRSKAKPLQIYPNPATDLAKIQLPEGISEGMLFVLDPLMRIVHSQGFDKDLIEFSTGNMNPGVYFLQVRSKGGDTFVGKLVISY